MKSDAEIKRYLYSALEDLEYINPDTLEQLKENIEEADLHFPLLDLYVKFRDEMQSAVDKRVPRFSKIVRTNQQNSRKIENVIKKYLSARLNQTSFGSWGKVGSSCAQGMKSIKDNLISIEQLSTVTFEEHYDKESLIRQLLASLHRQLDDLADDELKLALQSAFSQIETAFDDENLPNLLSSIAVARDILLSIEK